MQVLTTSGIGQNANQNTKKNTLGNTGLLSSTTGLAKLSPTLNAGFGSGLSINPVNGNIGQGTPSSLMASTLGIPKQNVDTANALTAGLPSGTSQGNQDVKKVIHNADGTKETHFYPTATEQPQPQTALTGNVTTPSGAVVNATSGQTVSAPPQTTTQPQTGLGGIVGNLSNFQTPVSNQANEQAQNTFGQTQGLINQLTQSRLAEAQALQNQGTQPIPLGDITGRQQVIANYYAQQQAGLGAGAQAMSQLYSPSLSAALTGQGQKLTGLEAAGQLSTPGAQFTQVSPGTSLVNSQGQQVFSGLGGLNQLQTEQIANAQRGQYGAQAQAISTGLNVLDNSYQNVQAIAKKYGINPSSFPKANDLFQVMQAQVTDPGGVAAFNEAIAQFKAQLAQQIQNFASTGALTPTASSSYMTQLNSNTLNPAQLGQLYDAVNAGGLANLHAVTGAFNESNAAAQNATFPQSFYNPQPAASSYTPPSSIGGSNPFDPKNFNL